MTNKKSIQVLRGTSDKINSNLELLDGQPLYDKTNNYLYVGNDTKDTLEPIIVKELKAPNSNIKEAAATGQLNIYNVAGINLYNKSGLKASIHDDITLNGNNVNLSTAKDGNFNINVPFTFQSGELSSSIDMGTDVTIKGYRVNLKPNYYTDSSDYLTVSASGVLAQRYNSALQNKYETAMDLGKAKCYLTPTQNESITNKLYVDTSIKKVHNIVLIMGHIGYLNGVKQGEGYFGNQPTGYTLSGSVKIHFVSDRTTPYISVQELINDIYAKGTVSNGTIIPASGYIFYRQGTGPMLRMLVDSVQASQVLAIGPNSSSMWNGIRLLLNMQMIQLGSDGHTFTGNYADLEGQFFPGGKGVQVMGVTGSSYWLNGAMPLCDENTTLGCANGTLGDGRVFSNVTNVIDTVY